MSKAEEKALEVYKKDSCNEDTQNKIEGFINGYNQAQQDNRRYIYRVVSTDQYQSTTPETCWTTNKQSCEEYIANSYYKHCLSIKTSKISDVAVKL